MAMSTDGNALPNDSTLPDDPSLLRQMIRELLATLQAQPATFT
jgi:hypothetical protein